MFDGFEHLRVPTTETEIATVKKGSGPPPLLSHGYPQTKAMWHKIVADEARPRDLPPSLLQRADQVIE